LRIFGNLPQKIAEAESFEVMPLEAVFWQLLRRSYAVPVLRQKGFAVGNILPEVTSFRFADGNLPEAASLTNYSW